jgi:hypothetical protein
MRFSGDGGLLPGGRVSGSGLDALLGMLLQPQVMQVRRR